MDHIDGAPHRLDFVGSALLGCALTLVVSTLTVGVLRHRHTLLDYNSVAVMSDSSCSEGTCHLANTCIGKGTSASGIVVSVLGVASSSAEVVTSDVND